MLLEQKRIYKPSEINLLLEKDFKFIKNNKKIEYMNIPISFDIETTSFYNEQKEKQAIMYAWVFGINGKCIIGRTWDEFLLILDNIKSFYQLDDKKRIIIWVHNLAFEFAFISHLFKWDNVFAVDERKPVYAISNGLEFRCSYILSGYSLQMLAKNLTKHKIEKLVGDLDYSLLRHTKTPLTEMEYKYILNDGLIVMAYIDELLMQYHDFHKLPLTKTGFVRKYCKKECLFGGNASHHKNHVGTYYKKYHSLMNTLVIQNYPIYEQLKRCYSGGFTHANALYQGVVIDNVTSYDFTSSYPSVMVCEKYPMSKAKKIIIKDENHLKKMLDLYCCMFDITFYNIEPKLHQDNPISLSKCYYYENVVENNGRVVSADVLSTTINEIDFDVIRDFYKWEEISITNFRIFEKGYLPTPFIKSILKLYELKTILKGSIDIDDIIRFQNAKSDLNSAYGMCVTDIIQMNRKFENGEWINEEPDIKDIFEKYNNSKSRFLYYPWGVWVTSYARRNLFLGIQAVGRDYLYSDTDSIKIRNGEKYKSWIEHYNQYIADKMQIALKWHNLPFSMVNPKTIKGKEKLLGAWDFDGFYKRFKTLGAKRYMYEDENNQMHITCSGVTKKCIEYLSMKASGDNTKIFDLFDNHMFIPSEYTGKNIHTYIDYEMKGYITDYLGNTNSYFEHSGVHLEGAEYSLSLSKNYIDYLVGIKQM